MLLIETISMRYRYPAHGHAFAVAACRLRAKPSEVRVVSFSPDPAGIGFPGESLLLVEIINAEGLIIIQTVWATTPDRRRGHRLHMAAQIIMRSVGSLIP